jgi:hypothetical protein
MKLSILLSFTIARYSASEFALLLPPELFSHCNQLLMDGNKKYLSSVNFSDHRLANRFYD